MWTVFLSFLARVAGNLNTNFPPQTTDLWLHEVGPDVTCYLCKVPDYIHEAFLDWYLEGVIAGYLLLYG